MSDSDSDYSDIEENVQEEKEKPKGIGSLTAVGKLGHVGKSVKDQEEEKLLGDDVVIVFQLPNGEAKKHHVNMGRPVEWLKVLIEREYGIQFEQQELTFEGKVIPNPLSLSDISGIKTDSENVIVVKQK